jgi:energy-coupling factor transporter ATP-binding protein EcfA2
VTVIFDLPITGGRVQEVSLELGQVLFVLGANGSGKSSLMYKLNQGVTQRTGGPPNQPKPSEWISAHRSNAFDNDLIAPYSQLKGNVQNIKDQQSYPTFRWSAIYSNQQLAVPISRFVARYRYDLQQRYDSIAADTSRADTVTGKPTDLDVLNDLLGQANLNIHLTVNQDDKLMASRGQGVPYPFSELSDGERSALNLIAQVLSADPGTILLIDEPEKHLPRVISVAMLRHLIQARSDCYFIISTHELALPPAIPGSAALLVHSVQFGPSPYNPQMQGPASWQLTYVQKLEQLDEGIRRDVLGARQKILFVEGDSSSLDMPLYSLLFPGVTVIPKGSCTQVETAVRGILGAFPLHDLLAYGLVDADDRTPGQLQSLETEGIFATSVRTVESIYYHPTVLEAVAAVQCSSLDIDTVATLAQVKAGMLRKLGESQNVLVQHIVQSRVFQEITDEFPSVQEIKDQQPVSISVNVSQIHQNELATFQQLQAASDLESLVKRYPIRKSSAIEAVVVVLRFRNRDDYERVVLKTLREKPEVLHSVRQLFGNLTAAIV